MAGRSRSGVSTENYKDKNVVLSIKNINELSHNKFAYLISEGALYAPLVTYISEPVSSYRLLLLKAEGALDEVYPFWRGLLLVYPGRIPLSFTIVYG